MECYKNIGGSSGVYAFECGSEYIKVQFSTGKTYLYTYQSAGKDNIEHMKILARRGKGLNSFINTRVKRLYDKVV